MQQIAYDPTESLELWLRKKWTSNPYLARERKSHMNDKEWARKMVMALNDSRNLFPELLTALDQMRWEDDFVHPPTPYSRVGVKFTTQVNMYPERGFNHERRLWSLIYYVIRDAMSRMNLCATQTTVSGTARSQNKF